MPKARTTASSNSDGQALTHSQRERRKQRLLTHGRSSMVRSITGALVLKDRDLFFLCDQDGSVPCKPGHGYGLYLHDCRYLNGYELTVAGVGLDVLVASTADGFRGVLQLTNSEISIGKADIEKEKVGVRWERLLDGHHAALRDTITFENYSDKQIKLPVTLSFTAAFEDIDNVRGLLDETPGKLKRPVWQDDGTLEFRYDGKDGLLRTTTITVAPEPASTHASSAIVEIPLAPREKAHITVSVVVHESEPGEREAERSASALSTDRIAERLEEEARTWAEHRAAIETDNSLLERVTARSLRDTLMLRTELNGSEYFSAGVPWFVALFGRDTLVTALQLLAFDTEIAASTLRLLARYQGEHVDDWRDEQPGKILHSLRVGELAHLGETPYTPYYGSVDATPLFLILVARHAAWTGNLEVFDDLREHVDRALAWIDNYGDVTGNGYVEYQSASTKGLINQGWKDSGDAIVRSDGSLAAPPIALVEVQGYVYAAKREIAGLFKRSGDSDRAAQLCKEADALRERVERDFWQEEEGTYAMALEKGGVQVTGRASNAGQVLWSGLAGEERSRRVGERLMQEDMFSGWGVRTLSTMSCAYNPIGYHLGAVWPHDNSLIAAGLRRYGAYQTADRIFEGILESASHFREHRLPEVFAGFSRSEYDVPVRYPVACHPQGWAAGSIPYLIESALGLQPDAFSGTLSIVRPTLPRSTSHLALKRLRVGDAQVDLAFERGDDGTVRVEVERASGQLRVDADVTVRA